jgi:hypothetical protein
MLREREVKLIKMQIARLEPQTKGIVVRSGVAQE